MGQEDCFFAQCGYSARMGQETMTTLETVSPALAAKRRGGMPRLQEFGLLIVIAILFVLLSVFGKIYAIGTVSNNFLNLDNLINGLARDASIYAIMAVAMTGVIISGGIDISVGSIIGLAAVMTAKCLQNFTRVDADNSQVIVWEANPLIVWAVALGVPLGIGLLCGLINGTLIVGLRLHPFVVTLGTMPVFRWAANLTDEKSFPTQGHALPTSFSNVMEFNIRHGRAELGLMPMIVTLLVFGVGWVYYSHTVWGRQVYAVGGNEEAARYSGLSSSWIKLRTYALMGLACGVAALVYVGRFGSAQTMVGTGYELTVIASAVVGGASLIGGRGTALGALLGALILTLIQQGISVLHLNEKHRYFVVGVAIILAAAIDRLSDMLRQKRLMASGRHSA
jgi:ribose/xylose/arabinose/galactoside ABC-type transport system permease subunit